MARTRMLAYSHDGFGLGHFRRNLRIATGLRRRRPDVEVLLATGASASDRFPRPPGIECLRLPSVVKVGDGRYVSEGPGLQGEDVTTLRAAKMALAVHDFRPDVLLVDRYPLGLHNELAPALDVLAQIGSGRAVLGLRPILDSPARVAAEWAAKGHTEAIRRHYSSVLVYGDPSVYDPVQEYCIPSDIAQRVEFTGYLGDELLAPAERDTTRRKLGVPPGTPLAVCTVGGGMDAYPVAAAFLAAMAALRRDGWAGVVLAGPYMDATSVHRLEVTGAALQVPVMRMVTDVPNYLAAADVAVSMAGYNTVCELLAVGVPSVVIPRAAPRQEQRIRAQRMAERGLVRVVGWERLEAVVLASAIRAAAREPRSRLATRRSEIHLDGVARTADLLAALLPDPDRTATPLPGPAPGSGAVEALTPSRLA